MNHIIRSLLIASAIVLLASLPTMAQNYPTVEVSGGFSYLHTEGGGNLYGWDASIADNLNRWLGLVGEFSGHYGSVNSVTAIIGGFGPGTSPITVNSHSNVYTFLFGPRFSYRKDRRFTPYAHVLPGFARSHFSATVTSPISSTTFSDTTTAFAMALGGGLDLRLSRHLDFRMIQADYLLTHFSSTTQNNARITTGLAYRF
jgi:opacity protein-like surface antigen